jgi:YHS domain-containing protein
MIDPVCNMEINEKSEFKSNYGGKVYFFCSASCKQSFDKKPDKYLKRK